jgi:flagellar hook-associated protein 1 FlgK
MGQKMANGMASLNVGATGLRSAQTGLNTTAHNLANVNTKGYTRQQVSLSDTLYVPVMTLGGKTENYGLGVTVSEVRRVRNQFIDSAYRSENSRLGYYSSQSNAVTEVEDLFGEMQGVTYQSTLTNLETAINQLSSEPSSTIKRSSLIQYASAFLTRSTAIYQGLKSYQVNLNTEVNNMVSSINDLSGTIYSLNKKIAQVESAGQEKANDLRDQRDVALDKLSKYIDIDYYETNNGEVMVSAEGYPLVTYTNTSEMSTETTDTTGLLTPIWKTEGKLVFNSKEAVSNINNNDKGELKGLLTARGNASADYTDVPVKPNSSDYDLSTTAGQDAYNAAKAEYEKQQKYYDTNIEPSSILSALAGLDKLVNGVVEAINNVLCPETTTTTTAALKDTSGNELQADKYTYLSTNSSLYNSAGKTVSGKDNGDGTYSYNSDEKLYTDAAGTSPEAVSSYTYSILDMGKTDYGMDSAKTVGEELFSRIDTSRYVKTTDASGKTVYVRNNLNTVGAESLYTLGNLVMNPAITQDTAKIELSTQQGGEDFKKAQALVDIFTNDFASLNPEQYSVTNINEYYSNFIGEFATVGKVLDNYVSNQQTMVDGYNSQRQETEGVSSDEELEKMIKYQQAYNASSRYINVVSDMIEKLVTSLGN